MNTWRVVLGTCAFVTRFRDYEIDDYRRMSYRHPHIAFLCLLASVFMHVALHHGGRCCMVLFTRNSLGWRNWFSFHHVYCSLHHGRFGLYYYEQYQLLYSLSCRMTSNAGLFFQFSGYNANVPVHALGPPTAVRLQNTGRFE